MAPPGREVPANQAQGEVRPLDSQFEQALRLLLWRHVRNGFEVAIGWARLGRGNQCRRRVFGSSGRHAMSFQPILDNVLALPGKKSGLRRQHRRGQEHRQVTIPTTRILGCPQLRRCSRSRDNFGRAGVVCQGFFLTTGFGGLARPL